MELGNERLTNVDLLVIVSDPEIRKVYLEDVPRLISEIRNLWRDKLNLEARVQCLEEALKHYANKNNWLDEYDGEALVAEQVIWTDINDNGTFPAGPDLALVALSGEHLKKEEEPNGES